jgi:cilia- and flagella-associated protein 52
MGSIKRIFTCCTIDPTDSYAFLGTKTGDIIEISLERALYKRIGPVKKLFSQGINCVNQL